MVDLVAQRGPVHGQRGLRGRKVYVEVLVLRHVNVVGEPLVDLLQGGEAGRGVSTPTERDLVTIEDSRQTAGLEVRLGEHSLPTVLYTRSPHSDILPLVRLTQLGVAGAEVVRAGGREGVLWTSRRRADDERKVVISQLESLHLRLPGGHHPAPVPDPGECRDHVGVEVGLLVREEGPALPVQRDGAMEESLLVPPGPDQVVLEGGQAEAVGGPGLEQQEEGEVVTEPQPHLSREEVLSDLTSEAVEADLAS